MAGQKGMDVEAVRAFGNNLKGSVVEQIRSIQNKARSDINGLDWKGPDAQQFKGDRLGQLNQAFTTLINKLEELGSTAVQNAQAQDTTSSQV
jgi:uncharacterized protein YukE